MGEKYSPVFKNLRKWFVNPVFLLGEDYFFFLSVGV